MKAYGYCRVSTTSQQDEGVSLSHQQERIRAWCVANGHELVSLAVETGSGARADNRAELQRTIAAACTEGRGAIVVVYSLSRFSRSVRDTLAMADQLDRSGANLASLSENLDTSNAVGRMIFKLLSTLNEFERDLLSERTTNALGHMRRQNKRTGAIPFGYSLADDGENLLPLASEQKVIQRIMQERAAGHTLVAIAADLNDAGIATKTAGKSWHGSTVASILNRQQKLAA
ncbi:MAG: recombinase family protein [Opitutaceae bacterium]